MAEPKIVGIHGGRTISDSNAKPLPKLLAQVRDNYRSALQGLLRQLFDSADDALFEMADKAGTNGDQALYFDAMRELRLQKKHIANQVVKDLIQGFNELGTTNVRPQSAGLDELDLIAKDELELKVAVEAMVSRIKNTAGGDLEELTIRIKHLLANADLDEEVVPGTPKALCDSFAEACKCLDFGIRAKLIVLKLFERYVLSAMTGVYKEMNQQLRQLGILPGLVLGAQRAVVARRNAESSSNSHADSSAKSHNEPSSEVQQGLHGENAGIPTLGREQCITQGVQFQELRTLLHHQDNSGPATTPQTAPGSLIAQDAIIQLLSEQQRNIGHNANFSNNVQTAERVNFTSLIESCGNEGNGNVSELDSDVISLVSMLFDFILDDRQLQPIMKALIARLQIPILKVAMLDRSFFDRGGHPARKLLNEIASAALGWSEKEDGKPDRLRDRIEQVVSTILSDFDNDVSVFNDLLENFQKFVNVENKRGQLVEQRTRDAEKGKAASDIAKQAVRATINIILDDQKSRGNQVPKCAVDFLNDAWERVLVFTYLKQGDESPEWKRESRFIKDLIWSVCPDKTEFDARGKLLKLIPGVMRQCRQGLEKIAFDSFESQSLLTAIEVEHVAVLNGLQTYEEFAKSEMDNEAVADLVRDTLEIEEEFNQFASSKTAQAGTMEQGLKDEVTKESDTNESVRESIAEPSSPVEVGLVSVEGQVGHSEIPSVSPETSIDAGLDVFLKQVERFSIGTWFEIEKGDKSERCKLAANIKALDKYIFVNRSGVKVLEKEKQALAEMLSLGQLQVLNDGLLFDRALESVIGSLRGAK